MISVAKHLYNPKASLTFFAIIGFLNSHSQSWIQVPDFPSSERDDGLAFVINDIAYCGTGYKVGWTETKDF